MGRENNHQEKVPFPFGWEDRLFRGGRTIVRILRQNGYDAVFAGGCVRDMIMNVEPQDVDVATDAPPDRVLGLFKKTIPVGEAFGVVIVRVGGIGYEVATFRKEGQYQDGRRPTSICFVSKEEDVSRRDFTCNGLLYDPLSETLLDYVGGRADIEARILRAIGNPDTRFEEDHLRLIRAVRFAVQLQFQIEKKTWEAIVGGAYGIEGVSAERVKEELFKLLSLPGAGEGLRLLWEAQLAPEVLPEAFRRGETPSQLGETCRVLDSLQEQTPEQALAAVFHLHDVPMETLRRALPRLRLSNKEAATILEILQILEALPQFPAQPLSVKKRSIRMDHFPEALDLFGAIHKVQGRDPNPWKQIQREAGEMGPQDLFPPRLLRGDDLIAMGFEEGKLIGELLERLEDEQLEGRIASKEKAMSWLRGQRG